MVGKRFDGASNMSGHVSGVSTRFQRLYPREILLIVAITLLVLSLLQVVNSVPDVRNFMDSLKELALFFKYSAKRKHFLREHLKSGISWMILTKMTL